jgi:hypothetical protein
MSAQGISERYSGVHFHVVGYREEGHYLKEQEPMEQQDSSDN